jgi:hypothetical protein
VPSKRKASRQPAESTPVAFNPELYQKCRVHQNGPPYNHKHKCNGCGFTRHRKKSAAAASSSGKKPVAGQKKRKVTKISPTKFIQLRKEVVSLTSEETEVHRRPFICCSVPIGSELVRNLRLLRQLDEQIAKLEGELEALVSVAENAE